MNREDILKTAANAISGDRHQDYGEARENFARIAELWRPILGIDVTPEQFALCMVAVKIGRLGHTPSHQDSWIDICGYAALGGEIATQELP